MKAEESKRNLDENAWDKAHRLLPQIVASVSTTIGALGLGAGMAWTSPTLPQLKDTCLNLTQVLGFFACPQCAKPRSTSVDYSVIFFRVVLSGTITSRKTKAVGWVPLTHWGLYFHVRTTVKFPLIQFKGGLSFIS